MYIQRMIDKKLYRLAGIDKTTCFTALGDNGRRFSKKAAVMSSTNSGNYQYTKFTMCVVFSTMRTLDGNILKNSGSPKVSNNYGDRVFVVARKLTGEGGQQIRSYEDNLATVSGFERLKDIENGSLEPVHDVYRIVYDPEILKAGYYKLKSNPAFMTAGADQKDLNSLRINDEYFSILSHKIKMEQYDPVPIKRVLIPKQDGKTRRIGISAIEDRIVQQSLLFLLEAIFEKTFSDKNHGFRPKKGVHTACKNIRQWKGISWFVEGDIVNFFDAIDHQKLMCLISQRIKDQQVIDLLWKILRTNIIIDGKSHTVHTGVPQGAVISPLLSNVYLHEFDVFVDSLKTELDTEKTTERNPEYIKAKSLLRSKKGVEKKRGYHELRKIKSSVRVGLKLYYIRYADDWLIGIWGSREDSVKVKKRIKTFLKNELSLELSVEKTKITHAGKQKAHFLGYDIYSPTPKESFFAKGSVKKRASHVSIYIDAPYAKIKERFIKEKFITVKNDKWLINAVTHWINYNHAEILYRYNWIIKGYLNYYSHVNNLHIFHKFIGFVLKHSCALTLGRKLKLRSRKKVFKKFGGDLKDPKSGLILNTPKSFQKDISNYKKYANRKNDPLKILKWTIRTQNLMQGPCVCCGSTANLQVHHVKKLSRLNKSKPGISTIMATLGRKQVPVCKKCHHDIHSGRYDKKVSPRKS
jgi:group II intron reverse transcriptase/maturase